MLRPGGEKFSTLTLCNTRGAPSIGENEVLFGFQIVQRGMNVSL